MFRPNVHDCKQIILLKRDAKKYFKKNMVGGGKISHFGSTLDPPLSDESHVYKIV